jgi:hypothetical protein
MKKYLTAGTFISATLMAVPSSPEKPFPTIQNCRNENIFESGEFLYWRFSSPNLIYGRSGVGVKGAVESAVTSGTALLPEFDYDPGFRLGLGTRFGPSKLFDLVGYYTWLYSVPLGTISGNQISHSFQPNNFFNSGTAATNVYSLASLALHLHLHIAEVQSGYTFPINRNFTLRPYIALTSYIIAGDLKARYEFTTPTNAFEISKTHGECASWSIGPKTGLDVIYHIKGRFGIFSNVNLSQQISHINMQTEETEEVPATGVKFVIQKGHLTENRNITLFGLEIGPTWDEWFCNYKYHVYFRATFQANNLNAGANLSFLNNQNIDLAMQSEYHGLNVSGMFEF